MSWRADFERRSVRPLRRLSALPRWAVVFAVVGVLMVGLLVRGPLGAATLVLLAGFLGWLLALSWPALGPPARVVRLAVVAGLVTVAATRLPG